MAVRKINDHNPYFGVCNGASRGCPYDNRMKFLPPPTSAQCVYTSFASFLVLVASYFIHIPSFPSLTCMMKIVDYEEELSSPCVQLSS